MLSYSTPPGYSFVGPAQTLLSPQLRHVYAVIARGTDIPAKEEGKVVWLWKDEVSSSSIVTIADANNAMQEDSVKPSSARKTVHKVQLFQELFSFAPDSWQKIVFLPLSLSLPLRFYNALKWTIV